MRELATVFIAASALAAVPATAPAGSNPVEVTCTAAHATVLTFAYKVHERSRPR